jgi:putative ABC transport system permease protein
MILLRLITLPYISKHRVRTLLTLAGIVLGVAVFVGMHTANQSVLFAFQKTIDRIAGATQLQVSAGEIGFDEAILEKVQAVPGVRVAVPVIEATVNTGLAGQGNLLILGVDMLGDRSLRDYDLEGGDEGAIDDPLVFLAQPDSLIVSRTLAGENHLSTNSKLKLSTMQGDKTFTVRGIMKSGGLASAFGGQLAVMDIYAAQKMFGRGRKFDRVDLAVNDGVRVEDVQARIQQAIGPGFQVQTPGSRGQEFESIAGIYKISANITSLFALFIGMFIIYNTFAIAVTQRRSEIGILRALGATQRQIRMLFLAEGAAAGLIASVVGVLAGMALARGMANYIGGLLGDVYGIGERAQQVSANPYLIGIALLTGMLTSVAAAFVPARNAARIDPVKALAKGRYQSLSEGENRTLRIAAALFAIGALGSFAAGGRGALLYAGYLFSVLAALLISPALGLLLSKLMRPVLKRLSPVEGTLAADSLIQAPRRTSGAVAALMLSLALVISLGGVAKASYSSIVRWLNTALNPDLFVSASESPTARSYRFPASMAGELRAIEGIAQVQPVRNARIVFRGTPIMLVAVDVNGLWGRARLPAFEGNTERMYKLAAEGRGVIVSDNLALMRGLHVNDVIDIPAPAGNLRMPIAGTVIDYSDQQGSILMDRAVYQKYWNDESINLFRVYLKPGYTGTAVRQSILNKLGASTRLFVMTNHDLRNYILRVTDQWFGLTYVQIAVAVLVAVLGIVNTLTVSITDRRRELGVLQAVGAIRQQIRRTIWIESLTIATLGLLLGFALGAVQLYYVLEISRRDIAGLRLDYSYPFQMAAVLIPVILGAAFLSGLGPAESAVHGSLVEALEYE